MYGIVKLHLVRLLFNCNKNWGLFLTTAVVVLLTLLVGYRYRWGKYFNECSRFSVLTQQLNQHSLIEQMYGFDCLPVVPQFQGLDVVLAFSLCHFSKPQPITESWDLQLKRKWFLKLFWKSMLIPFRYFFISYLKINLSSHQYINTMYLLEQSNYLFSHLIYLCCVVTQIL